MQKNLLDFLSKHIGNVTGKINHLALTYWPKSAGEIPRSDTSSSLNSNPELNDIPKQEGELSTNSLSEYSQNREDHTQDHITTLVQAPE